MIVRNPSARIDYLEWEIKTRLKLINRALRPGSNTLTDEEIADIRAEIDEIDDEIEELEEAAWAGKELIK